MEESRPFKAKVRKIGNSYGFIVPKDVIESMNLEDGSAVELGIKNLSVNIPLNQKEFDLLNAILEKRPKLKKFKVEDLMRYFMHEGFAEMGATKIKEKVNEKKFKEIEAILLQK